jgi:NAD(P)H-dependent flavin oxidoreductase YrpB (nitropropane dioxygenase family)
VTKIRTAFTDLVGCTIPIQLAAMGGAGTPELAAAVAEAGGLGMVPMGVEPPGTGAVGKNFIVVGELELDMFSEAARKARVVEFFYAWPRRDYVDVVKAAGALAAWQVGSAEEATAAQACGCDFVIAQGTEAGGHLRGTTFLDVLLPAVLDAVSVPVLAAGGIATAGRVAELMRRGASGVRVGTLFLATPECGSHPAYVRRLLEATGDDTVITTHYDEGWPDAPHRVLRASLEAAEKSGWRRTTPPSRSSPDESVEAMAMYAGTGVGYVVEVRAASEVAADLCDL